MKTFEAAFLQWAFNEEEALKQMEESYNKLFSEDCSPSDKPDYFEACHKLYKDWECVRELYVCHPRKRFYKDKLRKKQPKTYSKTREKNVVYTDELSRCTVQGSGLYFVTQEGNINGELVYAVKVGQTDDIKTRLSVYRTHNPFIKFNNGFLSCEGDNMKQMESNCYRFLNRYACNDIKAIGEWIIVAKEDYDILNQIFSDAKNFAAIAEGL